jgi:hypothetical protein
MGGRHMGATMIFFLVPVWIVAKINLTKFCQCQNFGKIVIIAKILAGFLMY